MDVLLSDELDPPTKFAQFQGRVERGFYTVDELLAVLVGAASTKSHAYFGLVQKYVDIFSHMDELIELTSCVENYGDTWVYILYNTWSSDNTLKMVYACLLTGWHVRMDDITCDDFSAAVITALSSPFIRLEHVREMLSIHSDIIPPDVQNELESLVFLSTCKLPPPPLPREHVHEQLNNTIYALLIATPECLYINGPKESVSFGIEGVR